MILIDIKYQFNQYIHNYVVKNEEYNLKMEYNIHNLSFVQIPYTIEETRIKVIKKYQID